MAEVIDGILIREVETKNIMTKSSLPVGGYSVNPYVGCTHACKYCYASFTTSADNTPISIVATGAEYSKAIATDDAAAVVKTMNYLSGSTSYLQV